MAAVVVFRDSGQADQAEDSRHVEVELRLTWWNRNAVGTMFGGSLFAMTDPFYALMLQHNLGRDYAVSVPIRPQSNL